MNPYEKACREWLKGCSCADKGKQEECQECTTAFLNHIKTIKAPLWSSTPPTVPGWYWCRTVLEDGTDDEDRGCLVEVMEVDGKLLYRHASMIHFIIPHKDLEWCGPITPPT